MCFANKRRRHVCYFRDEPHEERSPHASEVPWTLTNVLAMFVQAAACPLGDGELGLVGLTQFHLPTSSGVLFFSRAPRRRAEMLEAAFGAEAMVALHVILALPSPGVLVVSSSARNNKRVHPPLTG